jgi:hypothetical protein
MDGWMGGWVAGQWDRFSWSLWWDSPASPDGLASPFLFPALAHLSHPCSPSHSARPCSPFMSLLPLVWLCAGRPWLQLHPAGAAHLPPRLSLLRLVLPPQALVCQQRAGAGLQVRGIASSAAGRRSAGAGRQASRQAGRQAGRRGCTTRNCRSQLAVGVLARPGLSPAMVGTCPACTCSCMASGGTAVYLRRGAVLCM